MKLLLAGGWRFPWYEAACAEALTKLDVEIIPFRWGALFRGRLGKAQEAIPPFAGPALVRLNIALFRTIRRHRPDWVWIWRGTHILPWTLRIIRRRDGPKLISYNNDDPFGLQAKRSVPWYRRFLWFWYLRALRMYDLNFVYRPINLSEAVAASGKPVRLLKPYFVPWLHRPIEADETDLGRFECDVVFVGHYEADGREAYLHALVKAGLLVRLFGGEYWDKAAFGDLKGYFGDVHPVYGDDYTKALCGATMCLGLLSRMNRDTYTRRCFEIPACGKVLLCERTPDLESMFKDGEEAVFFSSPEELVERSRWLLDRPAEIVRIAANGRSRVWADGHDVTSRMREFLASTSAI